MNAGPRVCPRCKGTGRTFSKAGRITCPVCGGLKTTRPLAAAQAVNAAAYCYQAWENGQTADDNLQLAIGGALREGVTPADLAERANIPRHVVDFFDVPEQRTIPVFDEPTKAELEAKAIREPCQHCGVKAGEPCRSQSGQVLHYVHRVRLRLARYLPTNGD